MSKKLVWKAFETFEEMEDFKAAWLASLTPEQIKRRELFFKAIKEALLKSYKL
ncbi:MAG: hypothetical protein K9J37_06085 [Saprospiraceae bacterium]|nr:hypothetical protein [Saprospiraceae bacterium]MCF8249461.1 hypothetical protein [Saprospiraceae bacterium]MCF8279115.1 hypothetical protein [Bacteroidales bacterium]MCF8311590.1 hypothetical protein [Saprospiraceae bacterium]MCF8440080.1 hypothetical protein [Saprospiraceae bacterium]